MLLIEKEAIGEFYPADEIENLHSDHAQLLHWFRRSRVTPSARQFIQSTSLVLSEAVALALAAVSSGWATGSSYSYEQVIATLAVFWFFQLRNGQYFRRRPFWDETLHLIKACSLLSVVAAALPTIIGEGSDQAWLMWIFALPVLLLSRYAAISVMLRLEIWQQQAVIIGDGQNAIDTAHALLQERSLGYQVISFLAAGGPRNDNIQVRDKLIPVVPLGAAPEETLANLGHPHVIVALERGGLNRLKWYVGRLNLIYPRLTVVQVLRGLPLFGTDVDGLFSQEVMMLNVCNNLTRPMSRFMKRAFDIIGSATLITVLSPVFAALWFLVRRSGPGVIFGHERIGFRGQPFKCYKFRSMVPNAQEVLRELLETDPFAKAEWERQFKLKNDPRITPIGHFLRASSLDELPQLWNVLKGDMSLVGPRPVVQEEVERYGDNAQHYLQSTPGMTGLWQVSGRNDIDYDSRVYLDAWYVQNWSMWTDFVILMRTISVVLGRGGAY